MNITIGILAHVDAGKTTLAEQMLYHTKSVKKRGRVDHKDTFLDTHDIEKERGITIFSDQALMDYKGTQYYLVDTPGHVDFSSEMERAISIMDYAIIIISAVEGIEGHTETVWNLLKKNKVPTFFFINKIDRVGADIESILNDIQTTLSEDIIHIDNDLEKDDLKEELIEFVAERDENLLNTYLEDNYDKDIWLNKMKKMISKSNIYPCFSGSSLKDIGILKFLDNLNTLTFTDYNDNGEFKGIVYKIRHDDNKTKITHIKALSGSLKVRDEIKYKDKIEKITSIRAYSGENYKNIDKVKSGELFAVTGLTSLSVGDIIGDTKEDIKYDMIPALKSKVVFDSSLSPKDVFNYFKILEVEDPSLNVIWDENLGQIHIHVMGVIQIEILEKIVKERFNIEVSFDKPEILYKETIDSTVCGYGHFEPLGHYAEVHIKLEPNERNTGITFENKCHADDMTIGNQNLVYHHILERNHKGILTGSNITDINITLITGRAHNKHTSGGDFREATYRALRQGLEKAKNILLEPYYDFKIKVHLDNIGRVLADLQNAHANFNPPKTIGSKVVITGKVPVKTFMNYSIDLASYTHGKGSLSLVFGGYGICHNSEEVINEKRYNKDADNEYTSSSIFCSKGQGYSVTWDEAEKYMHCI